MRVEDCPLLIDVVEYDDNQRKSQYPITIDFSIFERFDDGFQTQPNTIFVRTHYLDFYRSFNRGNANDLRSYSLVDYDFYENEL
jgi:hypothetical protein